MTLKEFIFKYGVKKDVSTVELEYKNITLLWVYGRLEETEDYRLFGNSGFYPFLKNNIKLTLSEECIEDFKYFNKEYTSIDKNKFIEELGIMQDYIIELLTKEYEEILPLKHEDNKKKVKI